MNLIPLSANSTASDSSYTDSRKPGPSARCTRMAQAIISCVSLESLRFFPAFLLSCFIFLNRSFRAAFCQAGVVGHGEGGNRFLFDLFVGCVLRRDGCGNRLLSARREF